MPPSGRRKTASSSSAEKHRGRSRERRSRKSESTRPPPPPRRASATSDDDTKYPKHRILSDSDSDNENMFLGNPLFYVLFEFWQVHDSGKKKSHSIRLSLQLVSLDKLNQYQPQTTLIGLIPRKKNIAMNKAINVWYHNPLMRITVCALIVFDLTIYVFIINVWLCLFS